MVSGTPAVVRLKIGRPEDFDIEAIPAQIKRHFKYQCGSEISEGLPATMIGKDVFSVKDGTFVKIGHALLPPEGTLVRGWPRSARVATWLQRHQAHFLNPVRIHGLWALAPRITDATRGAVFGEVIAVDGDDRRILGRDDPEAAGTLPG